MTTENRISYGHYLKLADGTLRECPADHPEACIAITVEKSKQTGVVLVGTLYAENNELVFENSCMCKSGLEKEVPYLAMELTSYAFEHVAKQKGK